MPDHEPTAAQDQDAADLAKFGYKQELKRSLGVFSSFAVAFSYISPSTGIFTLYFLAPVDRRRHVLDLAASSPSVSSSSR